MSRDTNKGRHGVNGGVGSAKCATRVPLRGRAKCGSVRAEDHFTADAMKNSTLPLFLRLCLAAQLWLAASLPASAASFLEKLGLTTRTNQSTNRGASALAGALTQDQVALGLKEALGNGVQHAVKQLGRDGGFLNNLNVKIPMPEKLQTVEKTLRTLKQERLADEFVATMNRAAERAVPAAAEVFGGAIKQMSIADARGILAGPPDAATQYFRRTTHTNLFARFHPVVKQAPARPASLPPTSR